MEQAVEQIIAQVRQAASERQPLRIRGGGTKDFLGQLRQDPVLDTRNMSAIIAYEPSELVVTAGAGTRLADLEALLAGCNQCLAFEPPNFGAGATVGGMVAAALAGPARAASGGVRDYVLGVEMINGRGERLRFGGQVMKNVAGYDVSRLMAGSMGVLGVIVEVSIKVLPRATAQATLRLECSQAEALDRLNRWSGQPLPLNASCWEPGSPGQLVVRLRGAHAAVASARATIGGEELPEADALAFWQSMREQTHAGFVTPDGQCLWRLSVPDTTPVLDLPQGAGARPVEWGGALRWVVAPASCAPALRAVASTHGGTASIFRAGDPAQAAGLSAFHPLDAVNLRIQRALKREFDPAGIFNPGRMYADL